MEVLKEEVVKDISEITILGGFIKEGNREEAELKIKAGDITTIVSPTGSGKIRLLADIKCMAQRDTPTKRKILINREEPPSDKRFSVEYKLVAQLSQNMNFVMDLSVKDFLYLHGESRRIDNIEEIVDSIIGCANDLTGEKFKGDTLLTQLNGGQSRALMIADTALLL